MNLLIPMGAPVWGNDLNVLRLYGSLTPPQRQALQQDGKLAYGSLSPRQLTYIERLAFLEHIRVDLRPGGMTTEDVHHLLNGILQEPTELVPNGLPGSGHFTLKSSTEEVVFAYPRASGYNIMTMTPRELGFQLQMRQNPAAFPGAEQMPELNAFRMGSRQNLAFTFDLTERAFVSEKLTDSRLNANHKLVTFAELPEAIRKAVEEAIGGMKELRGPGSAGQKPPPP